MPKTITKYEIETILVGEARFSLELRDGELLSLGNISVADTALRNRHTRLLPWFDSYEGDVFRKFLLNNIETNGKITTLNLTAISDPDSIFRERRDSSGDLCFRNSNWDSPADETALKICIENASDSIDGHEFSGFRYWFEYDGNIPVHRFVDRQTWEIGGNLDDVTICLRNWLTPPRMQIRKETTYSTVGLDNWAKLLPGNLWGRWSLLPGFDLQYGSKGVLVGRFDKVSLIRTVVETNSGEDCIRFLDMHLFPQTTKFVTNPKTVLHSADKLDHTDALNLWTRLQDRDSAQSQAQFGIKSEAPPAIVFGENVWRNVNFDSTYENVIEVASEFKGDYVFIDPVFEHEQSFGEEFDNLISPTKRDGTSLKKFNHAGRRNMCLILDWEVNSVWGGREGLRKLCERANNKGLKVLSWMACHSSPNSYLSDLTHPEVKLMARGAAGVFAGRESGRHPDTGYPAECWTYNLNTPIMEWLRDRLLNVCKDTGLSGYLWDSFSNLGWWQLDYSQGDMKPQYERMAQLYADLANEGLYLQPEALVAFSNHSCCGLHGGNIYDKDLLGFSYNTCISLWYNESDDHGGNYENVILSGGAPIDIFFQCIAHKRVPALNFHKLPRSLWHLPSVIAIKEVLLAYREHRHRMIRRTVLKEDIGVRWDGGDKPVLFAFKESMADKGTRDALTGELVTLVAPNRVYILSV